MSLRAWLLARVRRFFSWLWLEKVDALPARRAANTHKPKAPVRLELARLEARETPDDLFSILSSGVSLGGVALINGGFDTPLSALLRQNKPAGFRLPVETASRFSAPIVHFADAGKPTDPATLTTPAAPPSNAEVRAARVPTEQPATQGRPTDGGGLGGWLDEVDAFLQGGDKRSPRRLSGDNDPPPSRNGGGGVEPAPYAPVPRESKHGFETLGNPTRDPLSSGLLGAPSGTTKILSGPLGQPVGPGSSDSPTGNGSGVLGEDPRNLDAGPMPALPPFGRGVLPFELNVGQSDERVSFLSRGPGFGFWLAGDELVFATPRGVRDLQEKPRGRDVFRMRMLGMSGQAEVVGRDPLASRSNYFIGSDPAGWHTEVPHFAGVEVRDAFEDVDLIVRSRTPEDRFFEYDFVIRPGAEVSAVRLRWEGLRSVATDKDGRLLLETEGGTVIQDAPVLYQDLESGRQTVPGRIVVREGGEVGFEVTGSYDRSLPLVIDPAISFATFLGGSGYDVAYDIVSDASEFSYVTGSTTSSNFPVSNGYDTTSTEQDAFVTKLMPNGASLVFSTYLGSPSGNIDVGYGIELTLDGGILIAGQCYYDFPVTAGAWRTTTGSQVNGFVTKLGPGGSSLQYSSYLAATTTISVQNAWDVATDYLGNAYVVGQTTATNYPTTTGAFRTTASTGFITVLNPTGSTAVYSSYVEGYPYAVAVDPEHRAHITGMRPVGAPPDQDTQVFVLRVSDDGSTLELDTDFGGSSTDIGYGIALSQDCCGLIFLTGVTYSADFPTTASVLDDTLSGTTDAFVVYMSENGTIEKSTYLGGNADDTGWAITVDAAGLPTVVGEGPATGFPLYQSFDSSGSGFITRLTATATLSYSSRVPHTGGLRGVSLVTQDGRGGAFTAGWSSAGSMTYLPGGFQPTNAGGVDAYVAKVTMKPPPPVITTVTVDSGLYATDQITNDQTISLSGTALANLTVTLDRVGLGNIGTTTANGSGIWTLSYEATTLPEGIHAFVGRAIDGGGTKSYYSAPEFLVYVDLTAPEVTLEAPASTPSRGPEVRVVVRDRIGVSPTATYTLDVDTNNDGDFTDAGETGYGSGTLVGGHGWLKVPTLSGTGTYPMRARALDLAGNQGTSSTATVVVATVSSPWTASSYASWLDVSSGMSAEVLGAAHWFTGLDLDQSPGTYQGGSPALVYQSDTVSVKPLVQGSLPSGNASALPTQVNAKLTFNGSAGATATYSTSGFAPGDVFSLAQQASSALTTTGRYGYSLLIQVSGQADQTLTGSTYVVAQDSSPFGAGWSFAGLDRLVSISADANGPAGMLRVYGSGGWRFYEGTTTFTSPEGDNGTLSVSGGTYTYSTPDGRSWTFNSSGYMTKWSSADGNEALDYRYDGSNRLTGITAIDGALTTVTYTGSSSVGFQTVNSRTTTLTLSSGDLTKVTNPDGGLISLTYDGSTHRLTKRQFGAYLEDNWSYTSAGTLGTYTRGILSTGTMTASSPTRSVYAPRSTLGLTALVSGTPYARLTDATSHVDRWVFDERGRPIEYIDAEGGRTRWEYSSGYISKQTDPRGFVTSFTRDAQGYVTKAELPDGSLLTYQYQTAFHALTTFVNERGNTTTHAYDSGGHLTRTTDALGNATLYGWTGGGLLEKVTDPLGNVTTSLYDSNRRFTQSQDALGRRTTSTYDSNGNARTTTDALTRVTTYGHDVMGRMTSVTNALGHVASTTYDVSGLFLTATDPLGRVTCVVYDSFKRGLLLESHDISADGLLKRRTSFSFFDDAGRTTIQTDSAGAPTTSEYSPTGRVRRTRNAHTAVAGNVYDLSGQLLASHNEVGAWSESFYDSRGRVTRSVDALGNVTTTAYDKAGNATAVTDALGRVFTMSYDALDRPTGTLDALGRRTTTTYDAGSNVAASSDHLGRITSSSYDALNRATRVSQAMGTGVQRSSDTSFDEVGNVKTSADWLGNISTPVYDAIYRQTGSIDPLGHRTTTAFDAAGNVTAFTDALGKTTTSSYDGWYRLTAVTDPMGHTWRTGYDVRDLPTSRTDPLGYTNATGYDLFGRQMYTSNPIGASTASQHDGVGGRRLFQDPLDNEWLWMSDALGREVRATDPLGKMSTSVYDTGGRVSTTTDRLGRTISNAYDTGDRLTSSVWKSAAGVTVNLLTYTHDDNDNQLTVADSVGTITRTYDELDRVRSYTGVFGVSLTYTLDANGNVTQRTDSLGGVETSVYDAASRLTSRKLTGSGATARVDFGYTDRDEQNRITWYSDLAGSNVLATQSRDHDDDGKLTKIVNKDGNGVTLSYYTFTYNEADRLSGQTWWSQVGTVVYQGTNTYTYDCTGEQLETDGNDYTYDHAGNRTMTGYQTTAPNRVTDDGTNTYGYDDAGNRISKSPGNIGYGYDHAGRLSAAWHGTLPSPSLMVTFLYDAEGNRVQEEVNGSKTRYVHDAGNVVIDTDGSNGVLARRIFGDFTDQILVRYKPSGTASGLAIYLTDHLGSVRDVADSTVVVKAHIEYDGYGNKTDMGNTAWLDRYAYTGREYQVDIGLNYHRARWYDPAVGRWISEDPIEFGGGDFNLNRYVGNGPTNATDPSGTQKSRIEIEDYKGVTTEGLKDSTIILGSSKHVVRAGKTTMKRTYPDAKAELSALTAAQKKELTLTREQVDSIMNGDRFSNTMAIAIGGRNATLENVDMIQYDWTELKGKDKGREIVIKSKAVIESKGVERLLSAEKPLWFVDSISKTEPSYFHGGGAHIAGLGPNHSVVLLDHVSAPAEILTALAPDEAKAGMTDLTCVTHFETYIVYKKRPVYRVRWKVTSKWVNGNATTPIPEVEGGEPVTTVRPEQKKATTDRYKNQTSIVFPK